MALLFLPPLDVMTVVNGKRIVDCYTLAGKFTRLVVKFGMSNV